MRLFKQLLIVFIALALLAGALMVFSYDIIKIQWVGFMGLQPSFGNMEEPLPVPARSIPVDGPAYIPGGIAPENPVPADAVSLARGAALYAIHCQMCHGVDHDGRGPVGNLFQTTRPADLNSVLVQSLSDGGIFLVISNGFNLMPALNENLTVRECWDLVNFVRSLTVPAP